MTLEKLWQTKALDDSIDRMTEYADVTQFRKLRLCGFSDTLIDVHLEWSHDGISKCIASTVKLASQHWRSEEFVVLMPYLRLHIINNSGKPNKELTITMHSFGPSIALGAASQGVVMPVVEPVEPAPVAPVVPVSHVATAESEPPKKRVWFAKTNKSPKAAACRDERLPGFLPMNSLLITDKRGSIIPLAPGNVGDVLMIACDGPRWISRDANERQTTFEIDMTDIQ